MTNESKKLSKSAQSVQDVLAQKGLTFEVVELSASTRTANDAAATPNAVFSLHSRDLESLTDGKYVPLDKV